MVSVDVKPKVSTSSTNKKTKKKDAPSGTYIPSISNTLGYTGVHRHTTEPVFIQGRTTSLDLETGSTSKHTHTHIYTLTSE